MTIQKSQEESDSMIVSSKLPREELLNFKKLCDFEDKTPSKKIRELINLEVDDRFGGMYKSRYDKEKIRQFQISAINDYNSSQRVGDIAKVNLVERTDGKFTQIGLRPLIDEDIFLPKGKVYPVLPSIGMDVANGEMNFLIGHILKDEKIQRVSIIKEKLKEFPREINFSESTILISNDFFVELAMSLMHRIKYENNKMILDFHHKLMFVPGEAMRNKIIIIEDGAVLWAKEKFHNGFTGKDESLNISIKPKIGGKVDITVRSVNRIKALYPEMIKILEVGE